MNEPYANIHADIAILIVLCAMLIDYHSLKARRYILYIKFMSVLFFISVILDNGLVAGICLLLSGICVLADHIIQRKKEGWKNWKYHISYYDGSVAGPQLIIMGIAYILNYCCD